MLMFAQDCHYNELVSALASLSGHSHADFILQLWRKIPTFPQSCEIKSASGLGTRLCEPQVIIDCCFIAYSDRFTANTLLLKIYYKARINCVDVSKYDYIYVAI